MKKYYLHNGSEQQGPFDLDDLKSKSINKDTPIWYEGLDNWTIAGNIDEIKEFFKTTTPPPFVESIKTPPPIQVVEPKIETANQKPKKKRRTGLWITFIILALVIIVGGIILKNNPNAIPWVKVEINTPNPIIVTSRISNEDADIGKMRRTVYATVQNQGGNGYVLVTFYIYQGDNIYERPKRIYLMANESHDLKVIFDEVKRLDGKITYNVEAIPN